MSRSHFRPAAPTESLPAPRAAEAGATVRTASPTATPAPEALTTLARLLGRQAAAAMRTAALNQSTAKDPPMKTSSPIKAPRLLSVQAVAAYLDMSEKTVRRLVAKGDLPSHRIGRLLRISEADLQAFLLTHRGQATEAAYGQ